MNIIPANIWLVYDIIKFFACSLRKKNQKKEKKKLLASLC